MYGLESVYIRILYFLEDRGLIELDSEDAITIQPVTYWLGGSLAALLVLLAGFNWIGNSQARSVSSAKTTEVTAVTAAPKPVQASDKPAAEPEAVEPASAPTAAPEPAEPAVPAASNCDPNYSGCVPIVPYDLNCKDIGYSVRVLGTDIHRLDRDGDGIGCESYGGLR